MPAVGVLVVMVVVATLTAGITVWYVHHTDQRHGGFAYAADFDAEEERRQRRRRETLEAEQEERQRQMWERFEAEQEERRQARERFEAEEQQRQRQKQEREDAKRKKELDMERKKKERVDEVSAAKKKKEEDREQKEILRPQVVEELNSLYKKTSGSLDSLLHALGIVVDGWPNPSPDQVRAAYRRALKTFHPDRAKTSNIRQLVEAEEKTTLLIKLKKKLP